MAHYDAHRNRGYGVKDPIYGARPAAMVAYSATAERYEASSEQVFTYGDYTMRPDLHEQVWPHARLKYGDEYDHSPGFAHANGSPRKTVHNANSPPAGHLSSVYAPHLDSPRKNFRDDHSGVYAPHHGSPRKNSGAHVAHPRDSPRKNFRDGRGARFSSDDDDDSSDDEVECRDGVCYPKPKHGGGKGYDYDYDYDKEKKKTNGAYPASNYDKEKKKANGYPAGNYPVQRYTDQQPRKDPHQNGERLPNGNGNDIYGSHSYNAPAHTKPTTDAYYDRFSHPATNNYNEPYAVPAPIKTRPDRGESSPVSAVAQWTPFATSPRKGHQGKPEMIDSTEAQRRYGNAPPQSGLMFGAAIDSETAARKYGGVFVK